MQKRSKNIHSLKVRSNFKKLRIIKLDVDWATLRRQKAPITFDHVQDTDTQNFVRMQDQITAKENSDPFVLVHKDGDIEVNTVKKNW